MNLSLKKWTVKSITLMGAFMKVINLFGKKNKRKKEEEREAIFPTFKDFALQIDTGNL